MSFDQDAAESGGNLYDLLSGVSGIDDLARVVAGGFRGECLQVRLPGVPFGEHVARAAAWWAEQANRFLEPLATPVRREHERVTAKIQEFLGLPGAGPVEADTRPRFGGFTGPPSDGFLVEIPGFEDVFTFNNNFIFDPRSREQRSMDFRDSLSRSPTPPSFREIGEILTTLDDLQDEAATLATVLGVVERVAGRAIPGVGAVALVADALNVVSAIVRPATFSGLPGKQGKRVVLDKGRALRNGYAGRIEEARRFRDLDQRARGRVGPRLDPARAPRGNFRVGVGDLLQGLQATDSIFGTGIQLGGIVGFLQDAFWGVVRGATFRAAGPLWDPLGLTEAGRDACFRSPDLSVVHPQAYYVLANEALALWSHAARIFPWVDRLGEQALASGLVGMRLAENVLGPWLRKGVWVELLGQMLQQDPVVAGGVVDVGTRRLPAHEYAVRTAPATMAAVARAITAVPSRERQALYESLVSSIGWGLLGDLEPGVRVVEQTVVGPLLDVFVLAEANRIPRQDLTD